MSNSGQCLCGCGEIISLRDERNRPRKFKNGHNSYLRLADKNPRWKGGLLISHQGYLLMRVYGHPYGNKSGYVLFHRLIMEEYLGRYLNPDEKVHHKDGDIRNNKIENLEVISQSLHLSHHRRNGDCVGGHGYGRMDKHGNRTH